MADGIDTRVQRLTREQIAAIMGNNPRAIKLFELLLTDVAQTLPDAIVEAELSGRFGLQAADGSKSNAYNALHAANEVESLQMTQRDDRPALAALRRDLDDAVAMMQLTLQRQASTIHQLRRDLDDARALIQGA